MSCAVKAVGQLEFECEEDLAEGDLWIGDDDEAHAEARAIVEASTTPTPRRMTLSIDATLTDEANVYLQDWLGGLAEAASEGHVDTWQEGFGASMFVRLYAGGREEKISQPFPSTS